jgi:signal transduction histidine kinase
VSLLAEMDTTVEMRRTGRLPNALAIVNSDVGLSYMREIQASFDRLRVNQQQQVGKAIDEWQEAIRVSTLINILMTAFTLLVLLAAGLLASREIGRRAYLTTELERQVRERTVELQELSEQLMRVSELEKSSLSRELHDELGSLLAAMKMDLANLRRMLKPEAELLVPWKRLEASIDAGIDMKRRVIENLRPTLLDNLGLVAALRWQAEEACGSANIELEIDAPEEEVPLSPDAGIAIFRAVQETLTNMLKHSKATRARMYIRNGPNGLTVQINDNGIGITPDAMVRSGAHGLRQMRFRMRAIGGEVSTVRSPDGGTETTIRYRPAPAGPS